MWPSSRQKCSQIRPTFSVHDELVYPNAYDEVRYARQHHALVGDACRQVHRLAVDRQRHTAEQLDVQTRCGDDDVGLEVAAGLQLDPGLGEGRDAVGDHRGGAVCDRLEQVAVGHRAQPLIPRVVGGVEVLVDRIALGQPLALRRRISRRAALRVPLAELVDGALLEDVLAARQRIAALGAEQLLRRVGEGVLRRHRHHVGRRALQHRHVAGGAGHRGHQGDRGRAAADDDDLLAGVVEVLGPVLRVHDLAAESVAALELRGVALVVAVVAACAEDPVRAELHQLAGVRSRSTSTVQRASSRRPRRAEHLVVEADVGVDAVLRHGLAQVGQDLVGRRDGVLVAPRLELVAERVQIGIRSNPGVAEQVPRAAGGAARLEDGVGPAGVSFCR